VITDGGAANATLVGKFLPQVPAHRGSVHVAYADPRYLNLAFGIQFLGAQFDDDQNVLAVPAVALSDAGYAPSTDPGLPRYALADLTASRAVTRNFEVFFGVQNLFDTQYFVGTLPTTIGSPRLVNGGVRVRWAGR
jgi:outer membrane receptor protein involved in Fe transport